MQSKEGIYNVYKEKGLSSYKVVHEIKKMTAIKKVGHAGTLDPLASGVLIVAVGKTYTKQLTQLIKKDKVYHVDIQLGMYSTTDDEQGEKQIQTIEQKPGIDQIREVVKTFEGEIMQTPPVYSALKIKGKPAYVYARKGQAIEMKPRKALIYSIEIMQYEWPILSLNVKTGSGVYIRSLARDIGKALLCGGYVKELTRVSVGDYSIEKAHTLNELSIKFANIK